MKHLTCAKAPCKSCPYRKDVPSGVWAKHEYDKLPDYDGSITDQAFKGAFARFNCHQNDGNLCAGWIGAHGASNLLAMRLLSTFGPSIDQSVWDYKSPVPLFKTGKEASKHGKKSVRRPTIRARKMVAQLLRSRRRKET